MISTKNEKQKVLFGDCNKMPTAGRLKGKPSWGGDLELRLSRSYWSWKLGAWRACAPFGELVEFQGVWQEWREEKEGSSPRKGWRDGKEHIMLWLGAKLKSVMVKEVHFPLETNDHFLCSQVGSFPNVPLRTKTCIY